MALSAYKKKRSFKTTPEPAGKKFKSSAKLHFVIQKHAASHLHYDLRLEMRGVLKSWAVPKGPSLNPQDKRLAVMVEDHPYAYKDFEGIIPPGNYGAGQVIIWDEGTYEIISPSSLSKGSLKFILYGQKLQGKFSLIKMKNSQKNWLLIKLKDKFISDKNILHQNQSVRSQRILADKKPMPQKIPHMLAYLTDKPFNRQRWIFEIKWDGYRIMAYIQHHQVKLLSRNQQDYTTVFKPISDELANLHIDVVLDGEIIVVDKTGHAQFQLLQQYKKTGEGKLQYCVFDILWLNGFDLRNLPLIERKKILTECLPSLNQLIISDHIETEGKDFFKIALKENLEGIMAKDSHSPYLSGQRSHYWLKIKTKLHQEVIICGYTLPRGSRLHLGALILGIYRNKQLKYVGQVGTGLNTLDLTTLKQRLDQIVQSTCPFKTKPPVNMRPTWVKPQIVAEISFTEWTQDGRLRQPVFRGIREDKLAQEVSPEMPVADETSVIINKHRIKLTHLSKIYWPGEEITKGDVISYYRQISSFILPYLKNYPQSLHRHPNGIYGQEFFQKNLETHPDWMKVNTIHSKHEQKDIHYLVCNNEATLVYLAQLGCIEINPWLSRITSLDFPDYCVIDLDPEEIEFAAVITVAQKVHQLLDKIGVDNYCKTSGATGLHIYIPLGAKYPYQQSAQFAELIATVVQSQIPEITSVLRSPAKRQGKIYLDYLQNRRGQTIAAPYSIRPRPQASVSTPLLWREVNKRLNPSRFNIHTLYNRLEKFDDLWLPLRKTKGIDLLDSINRLQKIIKS